MANICFCQISGYLEGNLVLEGKFSKISPPKEGADLEIKVFPPFYKQDFSTQRNLKSQYLTYIQYILMISVGLLSSLTR